MPKVYQTNQGHLCAGFTLINLVNPVTVSFS